MGPFTSHYKKRYTILDRNWATDIQRLDVISWTLFFDRTGEVIVLNLSYLSALVSVTLTFQKVGH